MPLRQDVLDPAALAAGVRLIAFDRLPSTNAEALNRARAGDAAPLWIVASAQTAGRGRRDRGWVSEPGNLFASLLLTDIGPAEALPQISFVAALAVHDAIERLTSLRPPRLTLKWPNDILLDGRKVSGILLEGDTTVRKALIIGIGVNCAHHPTGTDYPAADLTAAGFAVLPEQLLRALSKTMLDRLRQWRDGFAAIRADWLDRAHGLGAPLRARLNDRTVDGSFQTLDGAGRLLLRLADGRLETITAADVFPLATGA